MERARRRRQGLVAPETLEARIALSVVPNDPNFSSQWALGGAGTSGPGLHAAEAWGVTTGSRNVVVAVVDTGIDFNHPDLAANIWTNPLEVAGNGKDDDGNGFVDDIHGWDFVENDATPQDGNYHGTFVSGIIGAVGNNALGVSGVNWQVSILPLRYQGNNGTGYIGSAVMALNYITQLKRQGIPIVATNISWGGVLSMPGSVDTAIRNQVAAGITVVVASGNDGSDTDLVPRYPASFTSDGMITVAATDSADNLAGFSNYGATSIDVGAPGVGILSTSLGGGSGWGSGTSFAAPQVTGTVALLAAARPNATAAQIREAILGSVDKVPSLAGKVATGGRVNAFAALQRLTATVPPPPAPVVLTPLYSDEFNRPNASTLPAPWQTLSGVISVTSNCIVARSTGTSLAVVGGVSATDVVVRSTVNLGTSSSVGLVLRSTTSDRYIASLAKTATGVVAQIWRRQGAVTTLLGSTAAGATSGAMEFSAMGTRLTLSLGGKSLLTRDDDAIRTAGGVGYRFIGVGGTADSFSALQRVTAAGTPSAPPPVVVQTQLYVDEFNRPNLATLPAPWQTLAGVLSVTDNRVVARSTGTSLAVVGGVSAADVVVRSTVNLGTSSSVGLVLRSATSDRYIASLAKTATGVVAEIWRRQGAVTTLLGSTAAGATSGVIEFSAVGTRLSLSLDGTSLLALDDDAIRAAGGVGYRFIGAGGTADSFAAYQRG